MPKLGVPIEGVWMDIIKKEKNVISNEEDVCIKNTRINKKDKKNVKDSR
jgi:hypothetical protein